MLVLIAGTEFKKGSIRAAQVKSYEPIELVALKSSRGRAVMLFLDSSHISDQCKLKTIQCPVGLSMLGLLFLEREKRSGPSSMRSTSKFSINMIIDPVTKED